MKNFIKRNPILTLICLVIILFIAATFTYYTFIELPFRETSTYNAINGRR